MLENARCSEDPDSVPEHPYRSGSSQPSITPAPRDPGLTCSHVLQTHMQARKEQISKLINKLKRVLGAEKVVQ